MKQQLNDILNITLKSYMENIYTCLPGKITAYDPQKKKAKVQPVIKKYVGTEILDYPVINEVPVIFPSTRNSIIHLPISKGDGCLILFSKDSMENYLNSVLTVNSNPGDYRNFSLTDAVCLPGLFPFGDTGKTTTNTNDIVIEISGGKVKITGSNIELNGNSKDFVTHAELNTALQTFITALNLHIHPDPLSGVTGAPITPMSINITAAKTTTIKTGG